LIDKLLAKKAEVGKRYAEVTARMDSLAKQRAALDKALQAGRDEQLSLHGEHRAIEEMIKGESPGPAIPVEPDKAGTGDGEAN
jgi:hypothetical protein